VDDDDHLDELAEAELRREGKKPVAEQLAELAAIVAEQGEALKKLTARAEKPKFAVWNWRTATPEQVEDWVAELRTWLLTYVFVEFDWMADHTVIPPCWAEHGYWRHALGSLYQMWQKAYGDEAYGPQADPDLTGWWLSKWRDVMPASARVRGAFRCRAKCIPVTHLTAVMRHGKSVMRQPGAGQFVV
jgi:hypothetical protein